MTENVKTETENVVEQAPIPETVDALADLQGLVGPVISGDDKGTGGAAPSVFGCVLIEDMEAGPVFRNFGSSGEGERLYSHIFWLNEQTQKWHTSRAVAGPDGAPTKVDTPTVPKGVADIIKAGLTTKGLVNPTTGDIRYVDRIDLDMWGLQWETSRRGYKDPLAASQERAKSRYERNAQQQQRNAGYSGSRRYS